MAVQLQSVLFDALDALRIEPVDKRIRAAIDGRTVVDSTAAVLVWEPTRIVASYAIPVGDLAADLVPDTADSADSAGDGAGAEPGQRRVGDLVVLDPSIPFRVHSTPGTSLTITTADQRLPAAAFRVDDHDLAGLVILDWFAFDNWWEEDEPVLGHPRDPFHRIECVRSTRHVVVAAGGQVLADSSRPVLLYETSLPTRYYLPPQDVRMDLLVPSDTRSTCAYKGRAQYWSVGGESPVADVAWYYREPLHPAVPVAGLICFFTEHLDLVVDDVPQPRPVTPWS